MDEQEKRINRRKENILSWLKIPSNQLFLAILILAIAIRLYYFSLTLNQTLWWDEAEYMNMARAMAHTLDYNYDPVRPVMFSLLIAFFMLFTETEFFARFFLVLFSVASVIGGYYFGKEFYEEKTGLIVAFFMSVFYLSIFFTTRILVDIHSLAFFTFSAFLFQRFFKTKSKKILYWAMTLTAIGTLFRLTTAVILFAVLIYLFVTEQHRFLFKKEWWIASAIFVAILLPYLVWGYLKFRGLVILKAGATNAPESYLGNLITVGKGYLNLFPSYFSWLLLVIFILGLFSMYKLIIGFDVLIKNKNNSLKRDLFILLLFLIPLFTASLLIHHNEDRYVLNAFPALFAIAGSLIITGYNFVKKKNKILAVILLLLLLGYLGNFQLKSTDALIKNKLHSYDEVRFAAIWMKEHTKPSDLLISNSVPQTMYYSQRDCISFPAETSEEFDQWRIENNPKYYSISVFENSPEWAYKYPQEKKLEAVEAYFADQEKTQPLLIIYKL